MVDERETVPCQFCGAPTPMTGTKMCDNCYEVSSRISSMPAAVLSKILRAERPSTARRINGTVPDDRGCAYGLGFTDGLVWGMGNPRATEAVKALIEMGANEELSWVLVDLMGQVRDLYQEVTGAHDGPLSLLIANPNLIHDLVDSLGVRFPPNVVMGEVPLNEGPEAFLRGVLDFINKQQGQGQ